MMGEKCFYCADEIEGKQIHLITFEVAYQEKEEVLCKGCYHEWLHGIKG